MKSYKDFEPFSKDQAYWERNQLVVALSKLYPAWLGYHKGKDWDDDWRTIVYIKIPVRHNGPMLSGVADTSHVVHMQLSWHIHDSEKEYFNHLDPGLEEWDGHDTEEKYKRLRFIDTRKPVKSWWQFWK